jgi:uncharacterized protein (DUF3084 family)
MDRVKQSPEEARQEWLSAMQSLAEQIQKQQNSQEMIQELMNTYTQLLNTPGSSRWRTLKREHSPWREVGAQQIVAPSTWRCSSARAASFSRSWARAP